MLGICRVWSHIEMRRIPLQFGFTVSVGFLIVPTDSRVMQRFMPLIDFQVSQVSAEAASQPPKKSMLAFNREQRDLCP